MARHDRIRQIITSVAATATLLALASCTNNNPDATPVSSNDTMVASPNLPTLDSAQAVDLLRGTWRYMPGVIHDHGTLEVHATGEAILHFPDNQQPYHHSSYYVPNPPVNLIGTHLEMHRAGDVSVAAQLSHLSGPATLSLWSSPPVEYDESRINQAGLDITVDGSTASITRWTGVGAKQPAKTIELGYTASTAAIEVSEQGNRTKVSIDGKELTLAGTILKRQVWFGLDGNFSVDALQAYPLAGNNIKQVDTSRADAFGNVHQTKNGLVGIARAHGYGNKEFGTAVDPSSLVSDPNYARFIIQNFNEIETEMIGKFQALQPEEGMYQFGPLDGLVKFASEHNLTVQGHALVFNEAAPQWLISKLAISTPDEARQLMKDQITTVMRRYDGQHGHGTIDQWDVVNEPFDPNNWGQLNKNDIWYRAIGPSYIADAIRYARAANPRAKIGINDWALESDPDRRAGILRLLASLKAVHALPDYIGIEAHIDEGDLSDPNVVHQLLGPEQLRFMRAVAAYGVKVRYSEVSVANHDNPVVKAAVNAALVRDCLKAINCMGVNWWGADNDTGRDFYFTGNQRDDDPGDDAPTRQIGQGPIIPDSAWYAIKNVVGY